MGWASGDAAPDAQTQRKLFAASGVYFQNPVCAREGNVGGSHSRFPRRPRVRHRNKQFIFLSEASASTSSVEDVTRLCDRLYRVHRRRGLADLTVVLVDAYDMLAEDVRHAYDLYGAFDLAVKIPLTVR
jgi:hypothetical protein